MTAEIGKQLTLRVSKKVKFLEALWHGFAVIVIGGATAFLFAKSDSTQAAVFYSIVGTVAIAAAAEVGLIYYSLRLPRLISFDPNSESIDFVSILHVVTLKLSEIVAVHTTTCGDAVCTVRLIASTGREFRLYDDMQGFETFIAALDPVLSSLVVNRTETSL